jgi:hypothetical protein
MPRRKKDDMQISRQERMLQFVDSVEALKKSWAKCYRIGLCDLGHITTALSEAGFAKLKGGALAVHALAYRLGMSVTPKAVDILDRHAKRAQMMVYALVANDRFRVSYRPSSAEDTADDSESG